MAIAATPPAAPPAIAPTFELELWLAGEGDGEEDEDERGELGFSEVAEGLGTVRELVVPELVEELEEMAAPGANSGVSPTANALLESQVLLG